MKRLVLCLILTAVIAAIGGAGVVGVALAQHGHHGMAHKLATGVKLDVNDDPSAQSLTLRVGPLDLPAHTNHSAMAQAPDLFWTVPIDGWLIAYHPRLVDAGGNEVPPRLLHHVGFWNTARSDFLCPDKEEHIFGAGGEMNDWPGMPGYGYRVTKDDRIRIATMFHNPTDDSYPQAYLEVRVEYRARSSPGGVTPKMISVYPAWFDVKECGSSGYDLKPGKNVTSGEITLKYSGTLLGVGGHMHDFARRLVLQNLTRNQPIAALDANLDAEGRIVSMPIKTFAASAAAIQAGEGSATPAKLSERSGGYRLNRGEQIRVTAVYDNRTGKSLRDGAMGIVVGYFVPVDGQQMAALRRPQIHKDQ